MSIAELNMSSILTSWEQPFVFQKITKISDGMGGFTVSFTNYNYTGSITSPQANDLENLPEGYRQWAKYVIYTKTSISVNGGDEFYFQDIKYKILDKTNNFLYGFYKYFLIQDFQD